MIVVMTVSLLLFPLQVCPVGITIITTTTITTMLISVHRAAEKGLIEEVKKLVENDESLLHSIDDAWAFTPLHHSAHMGHIEVKEWWWW